MVQVWNDLGAAPSKEEAIAAIFKRAEADKIRNLIAQALKAKKTAVNKQCQAQMKVTVEQTKGSIQAVSNQLDSQMMGTLANKVKEVVGQQTNKYDQIF